MDLTSYAELAVLLVNSEDALDSLEGAQSFLVEAGRPRDAGRLTAADLRVLRELRRELAEVFSLAACEGYEVAAVERLNALLIRHPAHPQISGTTGRAGTCTSPRAAGSATSTPRARS